MKKNYFFLFAGLLFGSAFSYSQISIGSGDLLSGPDTIRMSQATTTGIPDPTVTGAGITWDYSTLVPVLQYVDTFVSVTSTPFLYQFYFNDAFLFPKSKANFGHKQPNVTAVSTVQMTDIYNFYQNNSKTYSIVGFGSTINGLPMSTRYDTNDVVYRFPMNYGNSDSSRSSFIDTIPTLGYYGQHQKRVNQVEGWGTLKTPFGTYSVLKVKSTLYITDTLFSDKLGFGFKVPRPVSYQYKWLSKGKLVPVLEIDESSSAVTSVTYIDSIRPGVVQMGIAGESNGWNFSIFPNPASDRINYGYSLQHSGAVSLELLNVYGQCVRKVISENQGAGRYVSAINKSDLGVANGIYFIRLSIDDHSTIRKIVIE